MSRISPEEMIQLVLEAQEQGFKLILDSIVRDNTHLSDVVNYLNLANSYLFEKSVAWVQKDGKFYTKVEYEDMVKQTHRNFLPVPMDELLEGVIPVPEPVVPKKVHWWIAVWRKVWKKG